MLNSQLASYIQEELDKHFCECNLQAIAVERETVDAPTHGGPGEVADGAFGVMRLQIRGSLR